MDIIAIGALEFTSIARGIAAADAMAKAAAIELIACKSICPGKSLVLAAGSVSAVEAAVAAGKAIAGPVLVDEFIIPNVHPDVFPALTATAEIQFFDALGVLESYSALTGIIAGDAAVKAANVQLIEIRLANGIGGKAVLSLTGTVADVEAAIQAAETAIAPTGLWVASTVIPSPHSQLKNFLV